MVLALSSCTPSIIEKRINDHDHPVHPDRYRDVASIVFLNPLMKQAHLTEVKDERKAMERNRDSKFEGNQGVYWDLKKEEFRVKKAKTRDPFISRFVHLD